MHEQQSPASAGTHVPFKQEGWGVAAFVVLLAVGSALSAYYVHVKTYKPPTDVRMQAIGSERGSH